MKNLTSSALPSTAPEHPPLAPELAKFTPELAKFTPEFAEFKPAYAVLKPANSKQLDDAIATTSTNSNTVATLDTPYADPDTEELRLKLNELLTTLRR